MDIFKKTLSELISKSKPLQYIVVVGFFVFGLVWINKENLAAQAKLQELLKTAYEQQGLCEEELIQLRKDLKELEKEIYKLKYNK